MIEVEEADSSFGGRGPGLCRPSSPALAQPGRRIGACGLFAGWWALGLALWGEALAPLQGGFPSVLGAPVGLVHLPPNGGLSIGGPGNGAPPPSKSSPYAIIYSPRAGTKHISKVYDAAPLNDRLRELIRTVIFVLINHGCFGKLGPLQGFNFFNSIH